MTKRHSTEGKRKAEERRQRRTRPVRSTASLHERLNEIAEEIARTPKTGEKADKKFFDDLSGR